MNTEVLEVKETSGTGSTKGTIKPLESTRQYTATILDSLGFKEISDSIEYFTNFLELSEKLLMKKTFLKRFKKK